MSEEKWLLIETAPKNATKILITDGTEVDSAYWDYNMWCNPYGGNNIQYQPTHWCEMPIPIPRTELEKLNAKLLVENKSLTTENRQLIKRIQELHKENIDIIIERDDAIQEMMQFRGINNV